ncbi:galactofuranosyltransferase [Lactiplantibacillus plantarum]|uniref:galactofuranosyltransferase n=1 Tax=Lactiplantibacillus plantarum TaxID=1590 RepID=UPI000E090DCF|nr:galactofuranosyltransferase [Lactiplantibacillus plantarum]RDG01723.1 galactofuranosyltransferase [Lactiplantibacillus plantarum]
MKGYLVSKKLEKNNNAGSKAKQDIEAILFKAGLEKLSLVIPTNRVGRVLYAIRIWKKVFNGLNEGLIVVQYPLYSKVITKQLVKEAGKRPNVKIVAIVHDIESLRIDVNHEDAINTEIDLLNGFDFLIVHNTKMKSWLIENGLTIPSEVLGAFDYLSDFSVPIQRKSGNVVNFAGNLAKSSFLTKITSTDVKYHIYGPNPQKYSTALAYKGIYSPEQLSEQFVSGYGLAWDGDSITTCSGVYGEYLKINNPHKVSLYIRSGLPVIVWDDSAMSDWVQKNDLGLSVSSLAELGDIISGVTDHQYQIYTENARVVAQRMQQGLYIREAFTKLLKNQSIILENYHG